MVMLWPLPSSGDESLLCCGKVGAHEAQFGLIFGHISSPFGLKQTVDGHHSPKYQPNLCWHQNLKT